jgi:putative restriction endonuclease
MAEDSASWERPLITTLVTRRFRDQAFVRHIQTAYDGRCAVTGIRMINGGGRSEAQAAHIQPVASNGPDSVRNGLALSSTVHWMFDRGLLAVDDDYRSLKAKRLIPEGIEKLFHPSGTLLLPEGDHLRPHPEFLKYHREQIFKG